MCQLIYIASVEALENQGLHLREVVDMWERCAHVRSILPTANHLYRLGDCQCYFSYSTEEEIVRLEKELTSWRSRLEGYNAFIPRVAQFLEHNRAHTPLWLLWVQEGEEDRPEASYWECPPDYFLRQDFHLPQGRSVIEILSAGPPELQHVSGAVIARSTCAV